MPFPAQGPVRCLLVRPEFLDNTFYNPREMFRMLGSASAAPPLGLLVVAAHLPKDWEVKLVDQDLDPVTDEHLAWADVLFLTAKGPQQVPVRRLAERAHKRGIPVVLGGAGPTLQPKEFAGVADAVVVGEAELVLPELIADLRAGRLKKQYRGTGTVDLLDAPTPRYDLAKLDRYLFVGMNYSRGCPFACEFCAQIEIFGRKPRTKTAAQIIHEHQTLYDLGYRGMVDFGYDNMIGDVARTEEVLTAMRDWNRAHGHPFCYTTEATMNLARLPKILELMRDNDFRYIFMGIESGDEDVLDQTKKGQNTALPAEEVVRTVNGYGIAVNTGLILGFDAEKKDIGPKILEMVQKTGAFPTLVLPLHALPGTELSRRLAREGRLFREGVITNLDEDRTDTATSGLNFVTRRPRTEILKDLAWVLEQLYQPKNHFARAELTIRQLKAQRKWRPGFKRLLRLSGSFVEIAVKIGLKPGTAWLFWKTFFKALFTNPSAVEVMLGGAVFNAAYALQSKSYVEALRKNIAEVEAVGEEAWNERMRLPAEARQLSA
ncbi:MAG: hypothetical protein AMXMBFR34_14450 [Myxococcaceae bacterium]